MRAEIGGDDADRTNCLQLPGSPQHLQFGFNIEAVTRLHLDSGHALGQQRVEARQSNSDKLVDRQRAGGINGGDDAAACTGDLFVACAFQAHFEFTGAVAAIDDVRVAIHETGRDPTPLEIDDLCVGDIGQVRLAAGKDDAAILRQDCALLDHAEPGLALFQGCQTGIAPDADRAVACRAIFGKIVPTHQLYAFHRWLIMYIHIKKADKRDFGLRVRKERVRP